MKTKLFFLSIMMIVSFAAYLSASSCDSCPSKAKEAETCEDGVCGSEPAKSEHKHEEAKTEHKHNVASVNTSGLKTLLDSGVPMIILDARSGKWDDGKRIPGALSLNSESKPEEIAKVLPNKEALIVTYCSNTKCPASHMLYEHLKKNGYTNLLEYPEGIQGWVEAGNPVNSSK